MRLSNDTPWMTIAMAIIVVIAAAVGGVVTIVRPETLNFQEYLDNLVKLAFAVAGLGAGRALKKGLQARALVEAVTGPAGPAGGAAAAVGVDPGMLERFAAHPDHPSNELDAGMSFPDLPAAGVDPYGVEVEDLEVELYEEVDEPLDHDLEDEALGSDGPEDLDDELADLEDDALGVDEDLGAYDAPVTQPGEAEPEISKPSDFRG